MSSNLMETSPGGETPQYESINTVNKPHASEPGQLGAASQDPSPQPRTDSKQEESKRFGETLSERGGVSGFTDPAHNAGEAHAEGEGAEDSEREAGTKARQARREQGYGGKRDMDRTLGG